MVGITSMGIHVPVYRLERDVIAGAWQTRSLGGERAVAGHDEDSLTMAVNAAHNCMAVCKEKTNVNGLFFSSTTSPYKEKQTSATIATALDLPSQSYTADIASSVRGATIAMNLAVNMVKSDSARNVIVAASDCRMGTPQSELEQRFGDAAAAVMIGDSNPIVKILDSYSMFDEFFDSWRLEKDTFVRSWEERFTVAEGYMRVVMQAVPEFLSKHDLTPRDFSKLVLCCPEPRTQAALAKKLGFEAKVQLQDPLFTSVGNTGTAAPLLMLGAALEEGKPGDKILLVSYGDGCDLFLLEVNDSINNFQNKPAIEMQLARKIPISYQKYLSWRDIVPVGFPRRPDPEMRSISSRWRERKRILSFYGVKCRECGEIQYPPQRVCVECGAKDNFDDCKFSHKRANVLTYATDLLTPTKAPPAVNVFVEFEGGGRMVCELTDCDSEKVEIGMPVEMTFRKLQQFPEMYDYFWKARPVVT